MNPEPPPTTKYSQAFENCWKEHRVGTKLTAWKAGEKKGFTDSNWAWLENYLRGRHKDDKKWIEGTYIPMLSTLINQERWTDNYQKMNRPAWDRQEEPERNEISDEERQQKLIEIRQWKKDNGYAAP